MHRDRIQTGGAPCNLGVFIDVFPLCNIPKSALGQLLQKNLFKLFRTANDGHDILWKKQFEGPFGWKDNLDRRILLWRLFSLFMDRKGFLKNVEKLLRWTGPTDRVRLISFRPYKKYIWERKQFDQVDEKPFENRTVPVPDQYDGILRTEFGDYMKFVKGTALHSIPILDLDTPYQQKLQELFAR